MKKILTLLCLALALTLICGAAMAEEIDAPTHEHVFDYTNPIYSNLPACNSGVETKVWFECVDCEGEYPELTFYPLFPLEHEFPFENGAEITYEQYLAASNSYASAGYIAPTCGTAGRATFYCKHYFAVTPYQSGAKWYASASCNANIQVTILPLVAEGAECTGTVLNEEESIPYDHLENTPGTKVYDCAICGKKHVDEEEVPVPHTYAEVYTVELEPTCTEKGKLRAYCTFEGCNVYKSVETDALGHGFLFAEGYEIESIDELDGLVGPYAPIDVNPPTCEQNGSATFACANGCGLEQVNVIKATGHDFWYADGAVIATVEELEELDDEYAPIGIVAPKCNAAGSATFICANNDCFFQQVNEIAENPDNHDWTLVKNIKPASCTDFGYDEELCNNCKIYRYVRLQKDDHTKALGDDGEVTTPATCIADGEKTFICTVCNQPFTERIESAPDLHPEESVLLIEEESYPATCEEEGLNTYYCKLCGTTYTEEIPTPNNGEHAFVVGEVVPAETVTVTLCGTLTVTCENCDYSDTVEVDHLWTDWQSVANPAGGVTYFRQCLREECGFQEEFLSKTGARPCEEHDWDEGVVVKPATVEEDGEMLYTCTVCGYTKTEVIEEIVVPTYTVEGTIEQDNVTISWEPDEGEELIPGDLRVHYFIVFGGTSYFEMDTELREEGGTISFALSNAIAFTGKVYSASTGVVYWTDKGVWIH